MEPEKTTTTEAKPRKGFTRSWVLLGIIGACLLLWSIKAIHHAMQPKYQGKTAQEWYTQFNTYQNATNLTELSASSTHAAYRAFQNFGPEEARFLWGEYIHRDSAFKSWCIKNAFAWSGGRCRIDSDHVRRFKAGFLLSAMGSKAECLLPELQALLKSASTDYERKTALSLLERIAPKDISKLPYLLAGLNSTNVALQYECLDALQDLGTAAASALPALNRMLGQSKGFDRLRIATTMVSLGDRSKLSLLRAEIVDPSSRLQGPAFLLLASLTKDGVDALPTLVAIAKDSQSTEEIKQSAFSLIEQISPGAAKAAGLKP